MRFKFFFTQFLLIVRFLTVNVIILRFLKLLFDDFFILEEYRMRGEVPPEEKDGSSNKSSTSH